MRVDQPELAAAIDDFYLSLVYPNALDFGAQDDEWQEWQREFARMYVQEQAQIQLGLYRLLVQILERGGV